MKKLLLPIVAALAVSACSSLTDECVKIDSTPRGAVVVINDEIKGTTPLDVCLPREGTFEVKLVREGYKDEKVTFTSLKDDTFIKFGPLVDMGYYKTLTPSNEKNEMTPAFLPPYKGTKAFDDMQKNLNTADQLKKDGKISDSEHSYLIKKIVEFYSAK